MKLLSGTTGPRAKSVHALMVVEEAQVSSVHTIPRQQALCGVIPFQNWFVGSRPQQINCPSCLAKLAAEEKAA